MILRLKLVVLFMVILRLKLVVLFMVVLRLKLVVLFMVVLRLKFVVVFMRLLEITHSRGYFRCSCENFKSNEYLDICRQVNHGRQKGYSDVEFLSGLKRIRLEQ